MDCRGQIKVENKLLDIEGNAAYWQCPYCEGRYDSISEIKRHILKNHKEEVMDAQET
ncbi:MAG: hypothetical protein ACFFCW_01840 [Candidatus Hodarchaeota archaeon]